MYKAARVGAQVQKQASWKNLKHFFLPFYIHHLKQIKVRKEKKNTWRQSESCYQKSYLEQHTS